MNGMRTACTANPSMVTARAPLNITPASHAALQLSIILVGGFHVEWTELGRYPFRIAQDEFNPKLGGAALGKSTHCIWLSRARHTTGLVSCRSKARACHSMQRCPLRCLLLAGAWLAMVLTFVCGLGLTFFVVRQTRRSWDYVVTTSIVHFVICCIGEALLWELSTTPHSASIRRCEAATVRTRQWFVVI